MTVNRYAAHVRAQAVVADKKRQSLNGSNPFANERDRQMFVWLMAVSQILVFISCCCNPIIYGITNENFRKCLFRSQQQLTASFPIESEETSSKLVHGFWILFAG